MVPEQIFIPFLKSKETVNGDPDLAAHVPIHRPKSRIVQLHR